MPAAAVRIARALLDLAAENGVDMPWSAVQYVTAKLGLPVVSIATLDDLLAYLSGAGAHALADHAPRVAAYRDRYGV